MNVEKDIAHKNYKTFGDVILTSNNVAFLIGGNHSVLKYTSGELSPTQKSIADFSANIAFRKAIAHKRNAAYLHIIFPDKQSVMIDEFPFQPVHRLGDTYLSQIKGDIQSAILYPADRLRMISNPACQPLDTHLTDFGSLEVLRMILDQIGMDAPSALARIERCITKKVQSSGDLGNKFDPPLSQESLNLQPDWEATEFHSPGGFKNDGMVEIFINPHAEIDKTVLIFGDSFFRLMLRQMSAVFSRVICLRTRFMHPEMVTLIQPEIILSGNAERYLAHVASDREAHAFSLYPHLRNSDDLQMSEEFLTAWSALTARRSGRYQAFLQMHGWPRK